MNAAGSLIRDGSLSIALLACLAAVACSSLNFPTDGEALSDDEIIPYPLIVPPEGKYKWAELSARGRQAMRLGQFQAAQEALLAALDQTHELPIEDVRVETSLANVVRLASELHDSGLDEEAGLLIDRLIDRGRAGHRVNFGLAAPVMVAHAAGLSAKGDLNRAEHLLREALRLSGVNNPGNAQLRLKAKDQLLEIVVGDD